MATEDAWLERVSRASRATTQAAAIAPGREMMKRGAGIQRRNPSAHACPATRMSVTTTAAGLPPFLPVAVNSSTSAAASVRRIEVARGGTVVGGIAPEFGWGEPLPAKQTVQRRETQSTPPVTPPLSIIVSTAGRTARIAAMAAAFARLCHETRAEWIVAAGSDRRAIGAVLAEAALPDWSVELLAVEDSTAAKAREAASGRAAGEILLFLDDDLIPQAGCLRAHLEGHRNAGAGILLGNTRWADGSASNMFEHWLSHRRFLPPVWEDGAPVPLVRADPAHWSCPRAMLAQKSFRADIAVAGLENLALFVRLAAEKIELRFASRALAEVSSVESPAAHFRRWHRLGQGLRGIRGKVPGLLAEVEAQARLEARLRPRWMLAARRWLGLIDGPPEWASRCGHAMSMGLDGRKLAEDITDEGYPSGT